MFTGIVETTGTVKEVISNGSNRTFWIASSLSSQFKVDQSVSHSGVCLTSGEVRGDQHRVTAIKETLEKTDLGDWTESSVINIERCLLLTDRLDGHIVQGHVDTTGTCVKRINKGGSWEFQFGFPKKFGALIIEKGSICVNGISLTAFNVRKKSFRVAVIPYTFDHTNIHEVEEGDEVNLEFDILGKYLLRKLS